MDLNNVQIEERCAALADRMAVRMVRAYLKGVKSYMGDEGGLMEHIKMAASEEDVEKLIEEDFEGFIEGYEFEDPNTKEKPADAG